MKQEIVKVLMQDAQAKAAIAIANINILLNNPTGVADHPDVMKTIQEQIDEVATQQGRLSMLGNVFLDKEADE
jgi:hypothetical protein